MATTGMLLGLEVASVAGANDGYDRIPTAGEIRERSRQRDSGSIIIRYDYGNSNPIEMLDPSGH